MTGVNNLTVEKIRAGNSNIRNPILVSYVAKGLLPYHGPGSGIKRALEKWSAIDFTDDHDGCLFTTSIHRRPVEELDLIEGSAKTPVETTVGTVQRRERVGKDSGSLSAKTCDHHSGTG